MIIDSLAMGGAEKLVISLANAMTRAGHHVDLISIKSAPVFWQPEQASVHVLGFKKQFFRYLRYGHQLKQLVKTLESTQRFDLIFSHLELATRLARQADLNAYHVIHSALSHSFVGQRTGVRRYLKLRKKTKIYHDLDLIFVSDGVRRDLFKFLNLNARSTHTLYPGVDVELIRTLAEESINAPADYIIHVGRLDGVKRHNLLINAYVESGISAPLLLVGEGNQRASIEHQIKQLGMEQQIKLLGAKDNPYPYIKKARLLVLSSDHEGFGIVLAEALCLGVPVVSTDCPSGPREILGDALSDQLVPTGQTSALADKIRETFESPYRVNPELVDRFSIQQIANSYLTLPKLGSISFREGSP